MAEAGSFADRVKQQADIVRVIGEYVRLKKSGQNFSGLCPFHQEKTPSFSVHATKQFYHCFGCGKSGDVFQFVMEMDKSAFPEAVRTVAEKCGIRVPEPRERSPEQRRENQQRTALVEMHRAAAAFYARTLNSTDEGKVARAYLEDRGLDDETIARFGLGYAPSSGDALLRHFKPKYAEKLLESSGLFSRDQSGRLYDRFRRRIIFPIANEAGKVIAFGGRALGDDIPKYLNSPETPIYTKSNVLYHLDRAKEAIRKNNFAVLVEGYMDTIAVARAGIANVVASCGTSLATNQAITLKKVFPGSAIPRVAMSYDPDDAGQSATERSIRLLLAGGFDISVTILEPGVDPDRFIREKGVQEYKERIRMAKPYPDFLGERVRARVKLGPQEKFEALNTFSAYTQLMPNLFLRQEWAAKFARSAGIDEPVILQALDKAARERRAEVKLHPSQIPSSVRPAERRLMQMLVEAEGFRENLARRIAEGAYHKSLETEKIFDALIEAARSGSRPEPAALAESLSENDRRLLFEILFESAPEGTWEEAESCLSALKKRQLEQEISQLQSRLAAQPSPTERREIFTRAQEVRKLLGELQ